MPVRQDPGRGAQPAGFLDLWLTTLHRFGSVRNLVVASCNAERKGRPGGELGSGKARFEASTPRGRAERWTGSDSGSSDHGSAGMRNSDGTAQADLDDDATRPNWLLATASGASALFFGTWRASRRHGGSPPGRLRPELPLKRDEDPSIWKVTTHSASALCA